MTRTARTLIAAGTIALAGLGLAACNDTEEKMDKMEPTTSETMTSEMMTEEKMTDSMEQGDSMGHDDKMDEKMDGDK